MKTLYEKLEVSENASDEIIEKAYKVLAKKYHPDLQAPENKKTAESKMKEINEAYDILSNSEKRKAYDDELKTKREEERRQQEYSNTNNSYNTNMKSEPKTNMQNGYNKVDDMKRRRQEEELRKEEARMRKQMEENLQQEYQNAYYDYLRSLGYRIKEKWTWKKTKELLIAIIIFVGILVILWFLPPTRQMMVDFYENNHIVKILVDVIGGIILAIFNGIKNFFFGD